MKTTMQIADSVFEEARKLALREHTTMKGLVEETCVRLSPSEKSRDLSGRARHRYKGRGLLAMPYMKGTARDRR